MRYVTVGTVGELGAGAKKLVTVDGKAILVVNVGGAYYAVDNACPHMGGSLHDGEMEGTLITCPRHGSTFDVTSGKVVRPGTLLFLKVKVGDVRTHPVRIDEAEVQVGVE